MKTIFILLLAAALLFSGLSGSVYAQESINEVYSEFVTGWVYDVDVRDVVLPTLLRMLKERGDLELYSDKFH